MQGINVSKICAHVTNFFNQSVDEISQSVKFVLTAMQNRG